MALLWTSQSPENEQANYLRKSVLLSMGKRCLQPASFLHGCCQLLLQLPPGCIIGSLLSDDSGQLCLGACLVPASILLQILALQDICHMHDHWHHKYR